jgi:hypothetical protein
VVRVFAEKKLKNFSTSNETKIAHKKPVSACKLLANKKGVTNFRL